MAAKGLAAARDAPAGFTVLRAVRGHALQMMALAGVGGSSFDQGKVFGGPVGGRPESAPPRVTGWFTRGRQRDE